MTDIALAQLAEDAREQLGATLVTVTVITPDGKDVSRVFSTHPAEYPVGGRKRLDATQTSPLWLEQVVKGQRPFLGTTPEKVREFFFDWATIEALGCGCIVNTPVVEEGTTIGSINFLAPEGALDERSLPTASALTLAATPAVARALAEAFPADAQDEAGR